MKIALVVGLIAILVYGAYRIVRSVDDVTKRRDTQIEQILNGK